LPLRAIVFDFDGVIANSEPLHFRAFRDVLAEHGVELSMQAYYEKYLGFDDRGVFSAVGSERELSWSPRVVSSLVSRKAVRLEEIERDVSVLFPGAAEAIERSSAEVPIAIASGALGPEIRRILDSAGLTRHFAAIVSAEDTPASKPAPDPYQRAVALLAQSMNDASLRPADCVAVEDSRWGLESAKTAGLRTVGVTSSYGAAELALADLVIPSLAELDLSRLRQLLS
jgi:beta-phosphoglucomutase-like phosphatase (HAD superfamily)